LRQFQYHFPHAVERTGREVRTRARESGPQDLFAPRPSASTSR
jgi:hypothetical protein